VIVCCIYPSVVWIIGQEFFPAEANGSLMKRGGKIIGSTLIGQQFIDPKYFHPRPSAAGSGYDAGNSGGSNLGPISKSLIAAVRQRVADYRAENGLAPGVLVPADAVTASASGLDPHISVMNAYLQAPRVAKARDLSEKTVFKKITVYTEGRNLGLFGEPRVRVVELNAALDGIVR
jgi:K+-transporting ATPase ATPase C chain